MMNRRKSLGWRDALIFAAILISFAAILLVAAMFSYAGALESGFMEDEFRFRGYSLVNTETSPQWSSDGSVIVANNFGSIYGVNVDGSKLWRIATAGAGREGRQYLMSLVDSRDRVAYIKRHYDDGETGWFIDEFGEKKPHKVALETIGIYGADIERVAETSYKFVSPLAGAVWSPDGSRIAYNDEVDIGVPDIVLTAQDYHNSYSWGMENILSIMSSDGSSISQFPKSLFSEDDAGLISPVWSRDGRKIAYVRHEWRGSSIRRIQAIVIANWDGTDAKTALEVKSSLQSIEQDSLEWSISNDLIYFIRNERRSDNRDEIASSSLMSVRVDGSDERVIIRQLEGVGSDVKASPDGKRLLVKTSKGIHVVSTDGVDIRKIYERQDIDESPNTVTYEGVSASWSPDGSRIAVQLHAKYGLLVFTMSPDGTDARVVIGPGVQPGHGRPLPEALGR